MLKQISSKLFRFIIQCKLFSCSHSDTVQWFLTEDFYCTCVNSLPFSQPSFAEQNNVHVLCQNIFYHVKMYIFHSSCFVAFAQYSITVTVAYQLEMMKNLRHVNIDHLHVGWYQSTYYGTYLNKALLDSQFNYQHSIEESIVLIYGQICCTYFTE